MKTTQLIKLLQSVEYGASGRSREISFIIPQEENKFIFLNSPEIEIDSTGDGVAGAELCLKLF